MFKKKVIMHGKTEFSETKGRIFNFPIETANLCNILPRPAVYNELILLKLKRNLNYRSHVYFEPAHLQIILPT